MVPQVMLRSVERSPFCTATSKFWMVLRTWSSCEAFGFLLLRVISTVPSTATAANARMISINASTQPQLGAQARRNQLWHRGSRPCCVRSRRRMAHLEGLGGGLVGGVDDRSLPGVEPRGSEATLTRRNGRFGCVLLARVLGHRLGGRLGPVALGGIVIGTDELFG